MELEKLRDLIRMLENSTLSEIEIEEEGRRIKLRKPAPEVVASHQVVQALPIHTEAAQQTPPRSEPTAKQETPQHESKSDPEKPEAAAEEEEGLVTINSPMVGVFYSAPAPGEAPFVKPGDSIDTDQTLCIVEAMKLMNEVTAKFAAVVAKCLVENGEPVEFGQPLFAVRPTEGA